ncbi:unnamed protein product [Rotaria sordida]|uniref:Uncharacterized protein n=1 Tax=Rotaria sordida TaxID=392033 RepID=A0A815QQV0_9BILA|nr:unnamed protein product [Rotaria sordida]
MPLLNKFTFNIHSKTSFYTKFNLPSNEYIQETFKDFKNKQIISSIDYFKEKEYSQCHIYSYPYQLIYYNNITNNFPGGIFECVREISLFDERSFEHEFFFQISQSFPFLKKLTLINKKPQNNKHLRKSKNQNQNLSIIQYPYLLKLDISEAHKDYHEQFLFDNKTCLPDNIRVIMNYQLLKKVTRNFRRITTRTDGNAYIRDDTMFIKIMMDFGDLPKNSLQFILGHNPGFPMNIQQAIMKEESKKQTQ